MAVSSEVGIFNLALNAVGERSNISLPNENSRRAEVCNLWYDTVRDHILEAAPWPEATSVEYLAQVSTASDTWTEDSPRRGYSYAYALPSDLLRPQYLDTFAQFSLSERADTRLLHTNQPNAVLAYTARQENIALWSASLRMAVAYGLAAHICMPLSGKPSRAALMAEKANELILGARVNAANSTTEQPETLPDWIKGRGYGNQLDIRFYYPTGNLLVVPNVN